MILAGKISLRGICRAVGVGLRWLLHFMVARFSASPNHLHVEQTAGGQKVLLYQLKAEADEMWSFVGKRTNQQWPWIALEAQMRQVLAFHVGDRSRQSAEELWQKMPTVYRKQATFYTDRYEVYSGVTPPAQHRPITKLARKTNHVERFHCTLRQRVARLARATLSFSKKLSNHIGAIRYFICHYNHTRAAALPG